MAKVSVIITSYNLEDYLDEAIESVLAQSFQDFEVIVLDDGSRDNSHKKAMDWAIADKRVKAVFQANSGIVSARNNAISMAVGEYIYPLDGDDKIHPNCLEKLVEAMNTGKYSVVYQQVEYFGAKTCLANYPLPKQERMLKSNSVVCAALFKKSDWVKYKGYDHAYDKAWEDWGFWLEFMNEDKSFFRVEEPLMYYRIKDESRNHTVVKEDSKAVRKYIKTKYKSIFAKYKQANRLKKINKIIRLIMKLPALFVTKNIKRKLKNISIPVSYPVIKAPKLIMTLLVKNEIDVIEENIKFHKSMGVDGFIVTDNLSDDGTRDVLDKYLQKGWILEIIDEPSQNHLQSDWVDRMILIAKNKYNADWVINADADELWYAKSGSLKTEISKSKRNKLYCPIYNMFLCEKSFYNSFLKISKSPSDKVIKNLSKFSLYMTQIPKVMHRAEDYQMIAMGNHDVDMVLNSKGVSKDVIIYHYPIRSLEHFKRKMIVGGAAYERNLKAAKNVAAHWRYFYEGMKNGTLNLDDEYEKVIGREFLDKFKKEKIVVEDYSIVNYFRDKINKLGQS